jgi:hypothetical protein
MTQYTVTACLEQVELISLTLMWDFRKEQINPRSLTSSEADC